MLASPTRQQTVFALPALMAGLLLAAAGCGPAPSPADVATEPVAAVARLSKHLRNNNLQGFAHDAVPPSLRPALSEAWRDGRTRWPLEELPFDHKITGVLATLSLPKAEAKLQRDFNRQFKNANHDLRTAAHALGMFGVKYLESDRSLGEQERRHYVQLVSVISEWGAGASLGDPRHAPGSIARLTAAARRTGVDSDADLRALGMDESLRRLGPMAAAVKATLRAYGLDLDASLDGMSLSLDSQIGDRALVRMRYPLAGKTIDTLVAVERLDGVWYLSDFLRHARAAAASKPSSPVAPPEPISLPPITLPSGAPPSAPPSS